MRRFYIEPEQLEKQDQRITGRQADHIRKVLRLPTGEAIQLVNGKGGVFNARITGFEQGAVRVAVESRTEDHSESGLDLTVAQG
ncbi:MAG: RNA methyltransferase PUA domain-containing protein, partial [Desulfosalsimonas sp.]